jgi:uncharacterized lipoprotein YmbA
MKWVRSPWWGLLGMALLLHGCTSAPTRFHTLAPMPPAITPAAGEAGGTSTPCSSTKPASLDSILLEHATVPAEVDRMQIVLHESSTRLAIRETDRWAAPLRDQIPNVLVADLRHVLPTASISNDPRVIGSATPLRLNVDIEEFSALAGQEATVRARWKVASAAQSTSQVDEHTSRQPVPNAQLDGVVLAWSRALAELSLAIAASLRCPVAAGTSQ